MGRKLMNILALAAALVILSTAGACALTVESQAPAPSDEEPVVPGATGHIANPTGAPGKDSPSDITPGTTLPAIGSNATLVPTAPERAGPSAEMCLNSRLSYHILSGTADESQLCFVLWAAGMAPVTGSYRYIFVATPDGTYWYDPASQSLSQESDEIREQGAFAITYDSERPFDTGLSYMTALLAAVSTWGDADAAVASCPKGDKLFFGVQEVAGLTGELAVHSSAPESSPEWLPDPSTDGDDTLVDVLADLNYTTGFEQRDLTLQQISQLLWAGYGCVPHDTYNDRMGLTVPSAFANYYLTGKIYLVSENGVFRYHNRNPDNDLTTRDHRLESMAGGDLRTALRGEVGRLPEAPCYVVLCLDSVDVEEEYALLETGFVAANMLVQASAMGLGCDFQAALLPAEQQAIRDSLGIPEGDVPQAVVSVGTPSG